MTHDRTVAVRRAEHPPAEERRLWVGLLAAPAAWALQGLLGWFFGERICESLSIGSVRVILLAISLAALAVAVFGAATAWRSWRGASGADTALATDASGRVEFMALGGVLVSGAFALGIVWAGLSSAFLNACGRIR